jgi:hypothetical protein
MIRFKRVDLSLLGAWLTTHEMPKGSNQRYRLRVWKEQKEGFAAVAGELVEYFQEALDDARHRLRLGFADSLSPFKDSTADPAANYPALLHQNTLFGYFGETLAALTVEHWGANGHSDWAVPALLFRLHDQEFQHLEIINERVGAGVIHDPDAQAERRPGRTGDDALAFRLNANNTITDIMALECKCLSNNNSGKIEDAHRKLSAGPHRPPGVRELINLLSEYDTPESNSWQKALLQLWRGGYVLSGRYDGILYACGRAPARDTTRTSWMSCIEPHQCYTAGRILEGMEFHFEQLSAVVAHIYRPGSNAEQ